MDLFHVLPPLTPLPPLNSLLRQFRHFCPRKITHHHFFLPSTLAPLLITPPRRSVVPNATPSKTKTRLQIRSLLLNPKMISQDQAFSTPHYTILVLFVPFLAPVPFQPHSPTDLPRSSPVFPLDKEPLKHCSPTNSLSPTPGPPLNNESFQPPP